MTTSDVSSADDATFDRRKLLKIGAWAAPVVVIAAAVPAASASPGSVPVAQLVVASYDLNNLNDFGTPGPLVWAGGQIRWQYPPPAGGPSVATVSYTVVLTGPGGFSEEILAGVANLAPYGLADLPATQSSATGALAPGTYTATVTAFGSDGSTSAQSTEEIVTATQPLVSLSPQGNKKYNVTFTLAGPPNKVINISTAVSNVAWNTPLPTSVTIGTNGTVQVSGVAHATGNSGGTLAISLTAATAAATTTILPATANALIGIAIPK